MKFVVVKPSRWKQHGPPICWYPTTTLKGATTQKTTNSTFTTVKTSNLARWDKAETL
jgi:hypothetical protein